MYLFDYNIVRVNDEPEFYTLTNHMNSAGQRFMYWFNYNIVRVNYDYLIINANVHWFFAILDFKKKSNIRVRLHVRLYRYGTSELNLF